MNTEFFENNGEWIKVEIENSLDEVLGRRHPKCQECGRRFTTYQVKITKIYHTPHSRTAKRIAIAHGYSAKEAQAKLDSLRTYVPIDKLQESTLQYLCEKEWEGRRICKKCSEQDYIEVPE